MKSYTITINGKVYAVTVEDGITGGEVRRTFPSLPQSSPAPAAALAPAAAPAPARPLLLQQPPPPQQRLQEQLVL